VPVSQGIVFSNGTGAELCCEEAAYMTLHYVALHYTTLRYVTLRYVTLRYIFVKRAPARAACV
jgi:hypothetical protein